MQKLFDAGYIDTLAAYDPAMAASAGSFTTQTPGQRLDYVLTSGIDPVNVRSAWIEQGRLAKYASDHFPVGADIAVRH
jgi:endonuclease/exonuclease/phosphatase family metal-dependent hydrolase